MNLDKEIKIEKQEQTAKKKSKQKPSAGVFDVLLQLYQVHPHAIQQNKVPHEVQDYYELLKHSPQTRSQKIIKKVKSELSEMKSFKIPPYNQTNAQFNQIFKRDNSNIIAMIAPFVQMTHYDRGHIVQVTGVKRGYVKILLLGEVRLFEPLNYKAFKNCQVKAKANQIQIFNILKNVTTFADNLSKPNDKSNPQQAIKQDGEDKKFSIRTQQQQNKKQIFDKNQILGNQELGEQSNSILNLELECLLQNPLSMNSCKSIMMKSGIMTSITPHKIARSVEIGDLIADKDQLMFVDQKQDYALTAICCTDCIFLQVGYEIAKQVISLIAADRQRPFIQSLLYKFPMLKYFEAKQYVTQDYMIVQEGQDENGTKVSKKSAVQIIKQLKVVSSVNFELSYTGELYLIISGNVTLIIDQISQKKPSTIEYVIPQKRAFQKQILHLYKNDIFGFEQIGKQKSTNLRYMISMGSKLLKINTNVMKNHFYTIFGYQACIKEMKKVRNQLIQQLLQNMQNNLQSQQIQRHQTITFSKKQTLISKIKLTKSQHISSDRNEIKQLKYYGHQNYDVVSKKIKKHFSPQNFDLPKRNLSPQIVEQVGLGVQFAQNLIKKSNQQIQIKDGWIYIRSQQGVLLRKKKIRQNDDRNSEERTKGDALLRKIGILNSKQIADHNLQMVKKRPSKYQFADLRKEHNQFKEIRQKTRSLPKITQFYAKKEDRLFSIIYKRTHL